MQQKGKPEKGEEKKTHLKPFCSAVWDLPTMILIRECPRSLRYVPEHFFEVTRWVVLDLWNSRIREIEKNEYIRMRQLKKKTPKKVFGNSIIYLKTCDFFIKSCPFLRVSLDSSSRLQANTACTAKPVSHCWLPKLCNKIKLMTIHRIWYILGKSFRLCLDPEFNEGKENGNEYGKVWASNGSG